MSTNPSIQIASSHNRSSSAAAADLARALAPAKPSLVLYFSTSAHDPGSIASSMEAAFAAATVIGCSTAGEIVSGKMLKGSVVAMALGSEVVSDVKVEILRNVSTATDAVPAALESLGARLRTPMRKLNPSSYVGLVLVDGLSGAEEHIMDALGTGTDVLFVGGSAGDDLAFQRTHVFAGGKALTDAALPVLLRVERGFSILKTQSFTSTGKRLTATKVDEARRMVLEFDGEPAARAYAAALGVEPAALATLFAAHPLGVMAGDEPFVRSPQQILGEAVKFYCGIAEGAELEILKATDIVEETRRALERKTQMLGGISGLVNFNCILRTLELDRNGQDYAYGRIFSDVPTVGFSTYGEAYLGHINQTATMLVLR